MYSNTFDPAGQRLGKDRIYQFPPRNRKLTVIILLLVASLIWVISRRELDVEDAPPPTPSEAAKTASRIAIITFITSQKSYIYLSLKNKAHYVRRHGYDLVVDYESHATRGTMWHKFDMAERVIKAGTHDWIWWMDFDTLITNTSLPLTDIIKESLENVTNPADVDFLVTNDCNNLNAGSFIMRSSPRTIEAFNAIRARFDREKAKGKEPSEQDVMRDFLTSDDALAKHTLGIPQWKINAFPEEIGCYDESKVKWSRGMLAVHFAGAWAHVKEEDPTGFLMKKYEREIIWGPPENGA